MGAKPNQVDAEKDTVPDGRLPKMPRQIVRDKKDDAQHGQPSKHSDILDGVRGQVNQVGDVNQTMLEHLSVAIPSE
jgi:hypothetical protein